MAKAVVGGAFLLIAEDFVGFTEFLEFFFGFFVAGILVGMVLERELAIGPLDFLFCSLAPDAQHLVVVALGHSGLSGGVPVLAVGSASAAVPLLTTTRAGRRSRSASLYPR